MSPYRDASAQPAPPRATPLWLALTPDCIGRRWRWYRRAVGGRWSPVPAATVGWYYRAAGLGRVLPDGEGRVWVRSRCCLGSVTTQVLGGTPVPDGCCRDYGTIADFGEYPALGCHCEEWPR